MFISNKNAEKINRFTIQHSLLPLLFIYISEIELFNRYKLNKTYIINRQNLVNLQT
ncbi:hypothetical protein SAMN02787073_0268 [Chryseobacterium vrystaatense]|uniref:Uncharacterized protein n=1 Tax=Chryseobacterium vrystaatense TaxID=307480 RepID=A0A1M4T4T3_9FLAO|nr:hypothetical protein SAMN02787073_0268 [Chryseobacterium vrystaatense]